MKSPSAGRLPHLRCCGRKVLFMRPVDDPGLQIAAASVLLIVLGLSQLKLLDVKSLVYLLCNAIGSEVLAMAAWAGHQWGLLIIEGTWSLISAVGLAQTLSAVLDQPGGFTSAILRAPAIVRPGTPTRLGR